MDLLRIAAEIVISRTAGPTLVMMQDMGYNPFLDFDKFSDGASQAGLDFEEIDSLGVEVAKKAWTKAGFEMPDIPKVLQDSFNDILHEFDHVLADPDFVLTDGGGSTSHSPTESNIEEIIILKLNGLGTSSGVFDSITESANKWLHPGAKTIDGAIDIISKAPISSPVRKKIIDSAVFHVKKVFGKYLDVDLKSKVAPEYASSANVSDHWNWGMAFDDVFLKKVFEKADTGKELLKSGIEDKMRKYHLYLRSGLQKLQRDYPFDPDYSPPAESLDPSEYFVLTPSFLGDRMDHLRIAAQVVMAGKKKKDGDRPKNKKVSRAPRQENVLQPQTEYSCFMDISLTADFEGVVGQASLSKAIKNEVIAAIKEGMQQVARNLELRGTGIVVQPLKLEIAINDQADMDDQIEFSTEEDDFEDPELEAPARVSQKKKSKKRLVW